MQQEWFWGTTLTSSATEYHWLPTFSEADESAESVDLDIDEQEHATKTLAITGAVLGSDVPDGEIQELELVTKNVRETEVTVTVAVLVGGRIYSQQMALELPCVAATLRLKRGSGPVHLTGKEFVDHNIDSDEDELDEEDEIEEEEGEELSNGAAADEPAKTDSKKRKLAVQVSNGKASNGTKVKRSKIEPPEEVEEEECDEDEDEEMEEEEEEKPPVKTKKTAKKGAIVKKTPTKEVKKTPKKKAAAKKASKAKA